MEPSAQAIEKMAAALKAGLANPRQLKQLDDELVTLYDHEGRPTRYPPIVAREIIKSQEETPRQPFETLSLSPPAEPKQAAKEPAVTLDALEETVDSPGHVCSDCNKSFPTPTGLKRHRTRMHKG